MDSFLKFHIVYVCFSHIEIHIHYGILTIYPVTSLNLLTNANNLALFLCVSYIHNYICQHGSIISLFSVIILLLHFFFFCLIALVNTSCTVFNRKGIVNIPVLFPIPGSIYQYITFSLSVHLLLDT